MVINYNEKNQIFNSLITSKECRELSIYNISQSSHMKSAALNLCPGSIVFIL